MKSISYNIVRDGDGATIDEREGRKEGGSRRGEVSVAGKLDF